MNDDRIGKRELDTWRVIALDALREMYPSGPVEARAYAQELGTQCALDERARIVTWLRFRANCYRDERDVLADRLSDAAHKLFDAAHVLEEQADVVERGDHLK